MRRARRACAPAGAYGTLQRRITAFIAADWEGLHSAFMSSVEGRRATPKKVAPELLRQERACDKASAGMRLIVDKAVPVTDADAAHAVLEPLHQGGGEITDAQCEEIVGWLGEGDRSLRTRWRTRCARRPMARRRAPPASARASGSAGWWRTSGC